MATNVGQAIVGVLESDLLTSFGPQLVTLIQNVQAAQLDPLKVSAAWLQFLGAIAPALVQFEVTAANQILSLILAKIQPAVIAAGAAKA